MLSNLARALRLSFRDFCVATSLNGYSYLQRTKGKTHKRFWVCLNVTVAASTIFIIVTLWQSFMLNPTVTSLQSLSYPVGNVPFPGVAICNVNKISKREVEQVAEIIASETGLNLKRIMDHMPLLGAFYDFEVTNTKKFSSFQKIWEKLPPNFFNVRSLLRRLTTPCDDLLRSCYWGGKEVDCSEIFKMRLTSEGWCCSFNYFKSTSNWNFTADQKLIFGEPFFEKGLHLVINNDLEDYFYTSLASRGTKINLFTPTDYPDKMSGGLVETLIGINSENFLEVQPTTVAAVKNVMNYPLNKRKCTFDVEQRTAFGIYSQSDCLVDCRIKSMKTLCGCVPFMIPTSNDDDICELSDIPCLNLFQNKWLALMPFEGDFENKEFARESQNALRCDQVCYPACESTIYDVATNNIPITIRLNEIITPNDSFVHIYYKARHSKLFIQDVVYYWFEILSDFGGTFAIMAGFSAVGAVEIFVYSTYKVIKYSRDSRHRPTVSIS